MRKIREKLFTILKKTNIIQLFIKTLFFIASTLPIRKKTVVFESFHGKQFSDNPKAIYTYMKKNYPDYKLYWSFDRREFHKFKEKDIQALYRLGLKWIFIMARAEYWVTNSRLPLWIPKRSSTTYVQTWHGTPLKKLGLDIAELHMPGTTTDEYRNNFTKESSKWDFLISPNAYSTEIFKRAFAFDREVVESGYPRNDVLFTYNNKTDIQRIKKDLKIPLHKKVILYAPTWRDNQFHQVGKYKLNLQLNLELMKAELGNDYLILLRTHYLVADQIDLSRHKDFVYDFSHYSDISHLYLISDLLITDYSSVFFDYASLRKPIMFFVYDIEEYREELRGFYLDFENNAPGPLVKTTEEIVEQIKLLDLNSFTLSDKYKAFIKKYCYLEDGNASKRVASAIFDNK